MSRKLDQGPIASEPILFQACAAGGSHARTTRDRILSHSRIGRRAARRGGTRLVLPGRARAQALGRPETGVRRLQGGETPVPDRYSTRRARRSPRPRVFLCTGTVPDRRQRAQHPDHRRPRELHQSGRTAVRPRPVPLSSPSGGANRGPRVPDERAPRAQGR